jgi:cytochrome c-type biogenesis protein CcmH
MRIQETLRRLAVRRGDRAGDRRIVSERRARTRRCSPPSRGATTRFWLAVAKEQDGDLQAALAAYAALLERARPMPSGARPSRSASPSLKRAAHGGSGRSRRARGAGRRHRQSCRHAALSGASPDAQSAEMGPEARRFVTRWSRWVARLKSNGKDLGGWLRLVRAYNVLGRKADAAAALSEARRNFATDAASLAEIDALAKTLGLES